eukprot:CAMPEP_0202867392 /NCGR_PEP_ID=MMETSP1391-20130828/9336_1 /ASSEMBLY_ACC=CAM_ASM_000867 /TAXON_ID=1034604 /ORGANISM="Chlamydomonas leiostraca, Strain SAG 11-49" /LENGTH=236 /DNA_ID=CAMNT_0049547435 /DNA_START=645 /DNA_END=1355 /DNA_ORIENTATION=-
MASETELVHSRSTPDPSRSTGPCLVRALGGQYSRFFPPSHFYPEDDTLKLSAWRTALAAYYFCPRTWLIAEVQCRLRALGLVAGRYIGIHIRRGDKQHGEGRRIDIKQYFDKAGLIRRFSLHRDRCDMVYVAFDDNSILDEVKSVAKEYGFRVIYDDTETVFRHGGAHPWDVGTPPFDQFMNDIKNFVAFVEAYTIVGADMSGYYRFARIARGLDGNELVSGVSLLHNMLIDEWMA